MGITRTCVSLLLSSIPLMACTTQERAENRWAFTCPDGHAFEITYSPDATRVTLKDNAGETTLPIARSGSGARYANHSTVFWNKGTMAFIELDGVIVHQDCQGERITP